MKPSLIIFSISLILASACSDTAPRFPAHIAVVFDLTSSANAPTKDLDTKMYEILEPVLDSLLPKGSEVAFFEVSPSLHDRPLMQVDYPNSKYARSERAHYNRGRRKTLRNDLKTLLSKVYQQELEPQNHSHGRSCIDNSLVRAGQFLQSSASDTTQKVLILVSDLLEQCEDAHLMEGDFWLWANDPRDRTSIDSARKAIQRLDPALLLKDTRVLVVPIDHQVPYSTMGITDQEFQDFWRSFLEALGASKVEFVASLPDDLGLVNHFEEN